MKAASPKRSKPAARKRAVADEHTKTAQLPRLEPEKMIWILGHTRTGSTWLADMMKSVPRHSGWSEPLIGEMIGAFYYGKDGDLRGPTFFLAPKYRDVWLHGFRNMVLEGAAARLSKSHRGDYLVIKDPHSAIGAPLLAEALPESRFVFLVRDPRDMVASSLDGWREGGWVSQNPIRQQKGEEGKVRGTADRNPDKFVRKRAQIVLEALTRVSEAYEAHKGPKALVRYEDLRARPMQTMKNLYGALGIRVKHRDLLAAVKAHAWESIPDEEKGPGKRKRKAKPGGWREDLTKQQARIVAETTRPILEAYYPDSLPRTRSGRAKQEPTGQNDSQRVSTAASETAETASAGRSGSATD